MGDSRSQPMTDPDIEAACEDITKGLKTHRGCSPGTEEAKLFAAATKIDIAAAVTHLRSWMQYIDDHHRKKYADLIEAQAKLIAHLVGTRDAAQAAPEPAITDAMVEAGARVAATRRGHKDCDHLVATVNAGRVPVWEFYTEEPRAILEAALALSSTPRRTDLLGCRRCGGHGTVLLGNRDRETCDLCHGTGADPDQSEAPSIPPAEGNTP
jgi:hypothetical protein